MEQILVKCTQYFLQRYVCMYAGIQSTKDKGIYFTFVLTLFFLQIGVKCLFFVLFIAPLSTDRLRCYFPLWPFTSFTIPRLNWTMCYWLSESWWVVPTESTLSVSESSERESVFVCLCSLFVKIKARVRNKINNANNRQ